MSCMFRSLTAYDPHLRDGLRCPGCGRIDWVRDGLTIVEVDEGVLVEGIGAPRRTGVDWRCRTCGNAAVESSRASRLLARVVIGSRYADLG